MTSVIFCSSSQFAQDAHETSCDLNCWGGWLAILATSTFRYMGFNCDRGYSSLFIFMVGRGRDVIRDHNHLQSKEKKKLGF